MAFAVLLSGRPHVVSAFSKLGRMNANTSTASSATRLGVSSVLEDMGRTFQKAFASTESTNSAYYTVGITGSSGLLGSALIDELGKQASVNGKPLRIVKLQRSEDVEGTELSDSSLTSAPWNPKGASANAVIDPSVIESMDCVVHLAGENVATGSGPLGFLGIRAWSDDKKAEILNSRVGPTKALATAIKASKTPTTFLTASGVGVYGSDFIGESKAAADESTDASNAGGFLADVSRQWEAASEDAGNNRVVNCRMGVVMSRKGGALAKLFPVFFLGGGGILSSGNQYFSFISARDGARALAYALSTPSIKGPVNICAPQPCTNAEFTSALGKVLSRPTILPFPGFAVSLLFGEMGDEMLSGGVRAVPTKLQKSGFEFQHPTILEALQSAMDEEI
eukprot:CAMPEP_0194049410 /NCGR_PEP_ID=MMETSP0009_2-20130614/30661_1 /TAXON_ID=210454 /ORGANISM="Grammatophora oceanica, Strain CCMP 410" /LENGTH=394 /DNA_ID=CAMNT_0038695567 /DNA_START=49 /DNA_END=1233 /DNA_ORIENTATION=-